MGHLSVATNARPRRDFPLPILLLFGVLLTLSWIPTPSGHPHSISPSICDPLPLITVHNSSNVTTTLSPQDERQIHNISANSTLLCTINKECFTCLRQGGCGWCSVSQLCIPADIWGPSTDLTCASKWGFMYEHCYVSQLHIILIISFGLLFLFLFTISCIIFSSYRLKRQQLIAREYDRIFSQYPTYQSISDSSQPKYNNRSHARLNSFGDDEEDENCEALVHTMPGAQLNRGPAPVKWREGRWDSGSGGSFLEQNVNMSLAAARSDVITSGGISESIAEKWRQKRDELLSRYGRAGG